MLLGLQWGECSRRYDTRGNRGPEVDRQVVRDEMEQAKQTFHHLLDSATVADLSRPSNGTKWTNGQLLFHMLLGYLIVVRLLVLVRIFGRLPDGFSRVFAGVLEALTRPFHTINYLGSVVGPRMLGYTGWGVASTGWSPSCYATWTRRATPSCAWDALP